MGAPQTHAATGPDLHAGFTLIEMIVVLALVAVVSGLVALGVRPTPQQQLSREGERLALWLESVRSQSRRQGDWVQVRVDASGAQAWGARPDAVGAGRLNWLYADTAPMAPVTLTLGPEPVLPAQQVLLLSTGNDRARVRVGTGGLGPWTAQ
jgi:general secretion pathway protein H